MKNKLLRILTSPKTLIVSCILAVALLLFGSVGGARAALTYYSETYASQVEMHDIGVTLLENDQDISNRDYLHEIADGSWDEHTGVLLGHMLDESDKTVKFGQAYTENLSVKNSGTIDTYVRVTIYRYWVDANGNKTRNLDPDLIDLHLVNLVGDAGGEQCWIREDAATTKERTVLYYNRLLPATEGQDVTPLFADQLTIHGDIQAHIKTETDADGNITAVYEYNGYQFILKACVDSVQDHNAEDAILSAWGKHVSIQNNTLQLQ